MVATAAAVQADTALTRRHLELLYGYAGEKHYFNLYTLPDKRSYWYAPADLGLAAADAARLAESTNVYVPRVLAAGAGASDERIKGDQAAAAVGLVVDLDIYHPIAHAAPNLPPDTSAALSVLEELPLVPSLVIDSGHGLQAWWLHPEPLTLDTQAERAEAAALSRRWHLLVKQRMAARGWHLDGTADLARVVRLAGTVNRKPGCDPVLVRIVADTGQRYNLDDFEDYLPCEDSAPPRERAPITEGTPLTAPQRIMVAALLQPHWRPNYRHALALHVAGWLADHDVPEADAQWIIDTVAANAGDTARTEVADTYKKARAGEPVAGWSVLTDATDPIITSETAAALDRLMRQREPSLVGVTDTAAAPSTSITGDISCQAELAAARRQIALLEHRVGVYRSLAHRNGCRYAQALRRIRVQQRLSENPYYDGRVTVARAFAREYAEADQRADGKRRVRCWKIEKGSTKSSDTVSKFIDSLRKADLIATEYVEMPAAPGKPPRTELYVVLPGLTLPETADLEARALAVEEYLAIRTPVAKRTGKKGQTQGGARPTCDRCGPDAEIEETVTRKVRCLRCDAILKTHTDVVTRYRNDGRAPLRVVAKADPHVAAPSPDLDADPWHAAAAEASTPATDPHVAAQDPREETDPHVADPCPFAWARPDLAARLTPDELSDVARWLNDQRGRRVITRDGLGTVVDFDIPLGRVKVRVGDADRWYSMDHPADPPETGGAHVAA